jgi:hypothetical protein
VCRELEASGFPTGGIRGFNIGVFLKILYASLLGGKLTTAQESFLENDEKQIDND